MPRASAPIEDIAWHKENSEGKRNRVHGKKPNAWGWTTCWGMYGSGSQTGTYETYYRQSPTTDPPGPAGPGRVALPAPFKSGTWLTSPEILPGEPSVVHHICFSFVKHKPSTVYNRFEWVAKSTWRSVGISRGSSVISWSRGG
jgi:hypothetical protein